MEIMECLKTTTHLSKIATMKGNIRMGAIDHDGNLEARNLRKAGGIDSRYLIWGIMYCKKINLCN